MRSDRFGVLFVCTGGRCRSPIAAALTLRLLFERFGVADAGRFEVAVAGTRAVSGAPVDPRSHAELITLGLDEMTLPPTSPLSMAVVGSADLVLTAERVHRGAVVQLNPGALGNTYCLREFARLMGSVACRELPEDPVERVRSAVAVARDNRGTLPPVPPSEDEVPDPFGARDVDYRYATRLISDALARISGVPPPVLPRARRAWRGRGR